MSSNNTINITSITITTTRTSANKDTVPKYKAIKHIFEDEETAIRELFYQQIIMYKPCYACGGRVIEERKMWRCQQRGCGVSRSIFHGTFFWGAKLKINDILYLLYQFLTFVPIKSVVMQTDFSNKTIGKYYDQFRELLACNISGQQIGGEGVEVQIDESKFARRKYNRDRRVVSPWVLGGVEKTAERRLFLEVVEKRDANILLNIIIKYVKPGSVIIIDCWKAYNLLPLLGYQHKTVNHSKEFVKPDGTNTNIIEGTWTGIKFKIQPRQRNKNVSDNHLYEFIWRRENADKLWEGALNALRNIEFEDEF